MKGCKIVACVALAALLALGAPAKADWIDTFDGNLGLWGFGNLNGFGGSSPTFNASIVSSTLQLTDPTIPNALGAGIGFGVQAELFTDVLVSAVLNPGHASNLNGDVGLLGRANLATLSTYSATLDFTNGSIDLSRTVAGTTAGLATGSISGFTSTNSVFLQLSIVGSNLQARYYDAPGGTLLASLSASDATFASGQAGVVVSSANDNLALLGTWDTVAAKVPEPAEILMLLGGGAVLGLIAVRRRRR